MQVWGRYSLCWHINYTDQLECVACHQEFLVDKIYQMKADGSTGFFGYENFRELV